MGGSAFAVSFLEQGLIDERGVILIPILLSGGTTMFDGIKKRHRVELLSAQKFKSGNVVLIYKPMPLTFK